MCVAGRLGAAGDLLTPCFVRSDFWPGVGVAGPLLLWAPWNSGTERGASRHPFSYLPSTAFGLTPPHAGSRVQLRSAGPRPASSQEDEVGGWVTEEHLHRQVNVTNFHVTLKIGSNICVFILQFA